MAAVLWGKVYYNDLYAGELRQEPGGRCVFTYDPTYLEVKHPAIAFTLPRQPAPHICEQGLHSFFDNLVAEGWLRNAQARALKIDEGNRFALLLAFGRDCAGAVAVIDPAPDKEPVIDMDDPATAAALVSRGSLSGVQPKLLAIKDGRKYRPARRDETSTYIAKLPSGPLHNLIENEFLTLTASGALLPDDKTVEAIIAPLDGVEEKALLIPRFDRRPSGSKIHFEEFNQLLGRRSGDDKYDAAYEDMASFIRTTPGCTRVDVWRLYRRILVCFLTGNTDAHLKNFAMLHTPDGLRLSPSYDLVAAALYPQYNALALSVGGIVNLKIRNLKSKHIVSLGEACGLSTDTIRSVVQELDQRRKAAAKTVFAAAKKVGAEALGEELIDYMERRWNGSFSSTGQYLSTKRSDADTE